LACSSSGFKDTQPLIGQSKPMQRRVYFSGFPLGCANVPALPVDTTSTVLYRNHTKILIQKFEPYNLNLFAIAKTRSDHFTDHAAMLSDSRNDLLWHTFINPDLRKMTRSKI
jgi:hypothetical protein